MCHCEATRISSFTNARPVPPQRQGASICLRSLAKEVTKNAAMTEPLRVNCLNNRNRPLLISPGLFLPGWCELEHQCVPRIDLSSTRPKIDRRGTVFNPER